MENLILPVAMIAIVVIGALSAYVADDPARKERAWKIFTLTLVTVVLTMTLSILFGGVWYGCARAEEDGVVVEYTPDEYLIKAADENEILIKVPYEGKWLSLYWDTSDESFKPTKIWVRIVDGEFCAEADYAVEEPEPIWFPPFILVGAVTAPVASKNKKNKMIQRLVPDLYMTTEKYIEGIPPKLAITLTSKKTYVFVCVEDGTKKLFSIPSGIKRAIEEINRIEKPAFATTFVESYKQQAVVACNYKAHLEYWRGTGISDRIDEAYKKLDVKVLSNTTPNISVKDVPVVKANTDKDDPFKQIVEVKYSDNDDNTFTFRCRQAHTPGDYVCVFTKRANETTKTYKNVKVVKCLVMKESEIKALAKSLGYSDISEVSHDYAVDTEEAWRLWRNTEVDPEDDPELYAPSAEEIAEFEVMREAYTPAGYRDF